MLCCPTPVGGAPDKPQWAHIPKIPKPQWGHIPLCCPTPAVRAAHIPKTSNPQWGHTPLCCPIPAGRGPLAPLPNPSGWHDCRGGGWAGANCSGATSTTAVTPDFDPRLREAIRGWFSSGTGVGHEGAGVWQYGPMQKARSCSNAPPCQTPVRAHLGRQLPRGLGRGQLQWCHIHHCRGARFVCGEISGQTPASAQSRPLTPVSLGPSGATFPAGV